MTGREEWSGTATELLDALGEQGQRRMSYEVDERAKYQKVADAFTELYEMENIVALNAGRYGFVESPHLLHG